MDFHVVHKAVPHPLADGILGTFERLIAPLLDGHLIIPVMLDPQIQRALLRQAAQDAGAHYARKVTWKKRWKKRLMTPTPSDRLRT